MITVTIDTAEYLLPSAWKDLTKRQLLFLVSLISGAEKSTVEIQTKLLLYCMGATVIHSATVDMYLLKTKQAQHALTPSELTALTDIFDFLFTYDADSRPSLSPGFMPNHYKRIRVRGTYIYGPNPGLDNLTYDEFVWLQTYLSQLDKNPDAINEVVNVLYKTRSGLRRIKYARCLPSYIKTIILWFTMGSLTHLQDRFPEVFSGAGGDGPVNVFDYQQRIIDSLAKGDVTRKDSVRKSLLFDALYTMEMAALAQKEMEKQLKKN